MKHRFAIVLGGLLLATGCSSSSHSSPTSTVVTTPSTTTIVSGATSTDPTTSPTATSPTSTDPTTSPTATSPTATSPTGGGYSATITRTSYGIPHIVAADWGGIGFGQGYAFAQDRACTLIDQVIKVRGERSKYFGAGDGNANVDSDFAYRQLGLHDNADTKFAHQPKNVADMVAGYVSGFDKELTAEGPHGWCKGAAWVQPITTTDLYAYLDDVLIIGSGGKLLTPIATAQPPVAPTASTPDTAAPPDTATGASADAIRQGLTSLDLHPALASNGWAIGKDLSTTGGGLLLANPHFPWEGEERLWESQLTISNGDLDVYGASLSGVPGVLIGFNKNVAWTHTVSAGYRMTLYSLNLVPGDPTKYVYGDKTVAMMSKDVTIQVLGADGTMAAKTQTMWSSQYGPMLKLPFGWTTTTAYTYRDGNLDDTNVLAQFLGMDAAKNMDDFIDVHRTENAIPWVNTIATSSDGRAWYADTATTPNLSPDALALWKSNVSSGGLAKTVLDNGAILLDGSNPINEWVEVPGSVRPGLLAFDKQPQLERSDYVFNSNDSHWLANPNQLLTGFSPLTGAEAITQSTRTRENARLIVDPTFRSADGKFSKEGIEKAFTSNRGLHSDLLLEGVLGACDTTPSVNVGGQPYVLAPLCNVLRNWDGLDNVSSKGAPLWREFLYTAGGANRNGAGDLYSVPFDPTDPVGTPNTIAADPTALLTDLATAATNLVTGGYAIDVALGEMQFDARAAQTERIALPGGTGVDGTISVVDCCSGSKTLAPQASAGTEVDANYFSSKGYPVARGNSFVMALEFGKDGPHADAVLTYGQPDDPADPNFDAQTKLYAAGTFRPVLFTDAEIAGDRTATTATVTGSR
jgi:acyl-homoserine-lactone acylase